MVKYACQRHTISPNRYIPKCSCKKNPSLSLDWYLIIVLSGNRYQPRLVIEMTVLFAEFSEIHTGKTLLGSREL